jgi:ABC-2 type transport system permease protein
VSEGELLAVRPLNVLQWLPTGAAARAIERASVGEWVASLAWLLYCAAWLLLLTWAWWRLVVRLTTGGGFLFSLPPRAQAQKRERVRAPAGRNPLAWLPPNIAQLALKELKMASRIPRRRVGILQGALMPFIFIGATLLSGDGRLTLPSGMGAALPFYALYLAWANTQNVLGWEGRGLALLLLTPVPRQRIFLAKGLALMLITGLPFLILSGLVIGLARDWQSVLGALTGLNVALAALAVTAVASVLFPVPIKLEGKRLRRTSSGGSCTTALAYMFLVPPVMGGVCLPVGVPLALAVGLDRAWIGVVGVLVGAVYAGVAFWLGARLAGRLLLRREAEVWAALQIPGEAE